MNPLTGWALHELVSTAAAAAAWSLPLFIRPAQPALVDLDMSIRSIWKTTVCSARWLEQPWETDKLFSMKRSCWNKVWLSRGLGLILKPVSLTQAVPSYQGLQKQSAPQWAPACCQLTPVILETGQSRLGSLTCEITSNKVFHFFFFPK